MTCVQCAPSVEDQSVFPSKRTHILPPYTTARPGLLGPHGAREVAWVQCTPSLECQTSDSSDVPPMTVRHDGAEGRP